MLVDYEELFKDKSSDEKMLTFMQSLYSSLYKTMVSKIL